ncbi:hypothetical protein DKT77_11770, partial [Meridianimarinicoccus roseus]
DTTGTLGLVTDNGDGTFGYDPNGAFEALAAGEQATDSFTYTVDDGQGGSDTATVTVAITGQNDAPVAMDDSYDTAGNTTVADNLLANDSDPDSTDVLEVSAVQGSAAAVGTTIALASGAEVTVGQNGDFTYNANGAFDGLLRDMAAVDTFTYTVSDGNGGLDTASVGIVVNADQDSDGVADIEDNAVFVFNPSQYDSDGDGYGNIIDADFDNDRVIGSADAAYFVGAFGTTDPHADLDGDGVVGSGDAALFVSLFGQPLGASAFDFIV